MLLHTKFQALGLVVLTRRFLNFSFRTANPMKADYSHEISRLFSSDNLFLKMSQA